MGNVLKLLSGIMILTFLAVGCGENKDTKNDILRVGLTADYPPFEFIKDDQIVGFDIDLANAIAKDLNMQIELIDMDLDGLIPALSTNRIDCIISGMTVTEERKKNVAFSVPYFTPQFAMLYRRDEPISTIKDLNNSIIGVQLGSAMESYLKDQAAQVENLRIVSLKRNHILTQELVLARYDGVLVEEAQAKEFVKIHPDLDYNLFGSQDMGVAVAVQLHSPWKTKIDSALIKLRDSGELAKIKEKWLGDN